MRSNSKPWKFVKRCEQLERIYPILVLLWIKERIILIQSNQFFPILLLLEHHFLFSLFLDFNILIPHRRHPFRLLIRKFLILILILFPKGFPHILFFHNFPFRLRILVILKRGDLLYCLNKRTGELFI